MANTFQGYDIAAQRTASLLPPQEHLIRGTLGLVGESGEYADMVKKQLFHAHAPNREKALDELGDILWYIADAARAWGSDIGDVANRNIDKLMRRYPDGFSAERSVNRAE